jgi:hypothetical protein
VIDHIHSNNPHKNWTIVNLDSWKKNIKNFGMNQIKPKRVAVVSYDDRKNNKDIITLKNINEKYCLKNGYDFLFFDSYSPFDSTYPPYWIKVKILYDLSKSNLYDYLMWIDSDACVHNQNIKIENLFNFNHQGAFIMAPDYPYPISKFNSGIWMVKNNEIGKKILKDWLLLYDNKTWKKKNGKWICSGFWAGESYEQGAGKKLLKNEKYSQYVIYLPGSTLQNFKPVSEAFTLHFVGRLKKYIQAYANGQQYAPSLFEHF